jgi:superfamily II DNA or RNA helicase
VTLRNYRLDEAFEAVLRTMSLRRPQRKSLEVVHELIRALPRDLPELSKSQLVDGLRHERPHWNFSDGFPRMTFELATGVGKTRLIAAIAVYLFKTGQSRNFLILAPRRAILHKFVETSAPGAPKYLFVDSALVPDPDVVHAGNFESFAPGPKEATREGPTVFIFSPQSFVGDDRRVTRESDFSPESLVQHLKRLDDLIVFMDEAHHLGDAEEDATPPAWAKAIRDLSPKFRFDMTATPRKGANIGFSYNLATCLREKLYTKDVRMIVRERVDRDRISDEDWDHHTLDFAIDRLETKKQALEAWREQTGTAHRVNPVLLVCARNTEHADEIAAWLRDRRGIPSEDVLTVHSKLREGRQSQRVGKLDEETESTLERLVSIEGPNSRVRIVVNVFALTEGWDVSNVYVVAPLRTMGTFEGAVQTMGRGLRLPFGRRVEDPEIDGLDVLCFGSESLQSVLNKAIANFGSEEDQESPVDVADSSDQGFRRIEETKIFKLEVVESVEVPVPTVTVRPPDPDFDFDLRAITAGPARGAVQFDLSEREIGGTVEALRFDFDVFIGLVSARVLKQLTYLSEPLHRREVEDLCRRLLEEFGCSKVTPVGLDWVKIATAVAEGIDKPYRRKNVEVSVAPETRALSFPAVEWRVPKSFQAPLSAGSLNEWSTSFSRLPIAGWAKCAHSAAAFTTKPEFLAARVLDSSRNVRWWVRNEPARLRLSTPIGYYEPDFVFALGRSGNPLYVALETKDSSRWHPPDSDPRIKARAAHLWCRTVSENSKAKWSHWVVLDADIEEVTSVEDLERIQVRNLQT